MFTLEQIGKAYAKVKSGADFPAYINDLKQLGIAGYETFVKDGHTNYFGSDHIELSSPAKYPALLVEGRSDAGGFTRDLKAHQQGKTDYFTFCTDCARSGVEKWVVSIKEMTCTYYDKTGNTVLVEAIPG